MGRNSQQRRAHKQRQQATRQRSAPVRTSTGGSSPTLDELIGFACEAAFGPGADKALFARTMVLLQSLEAEANPLDRPSTRVVQVLHRGWDQHGNLPADIRLQCRDPDQPIGALWCTW